MDKEKSELQTILSTTQDQLEKVVSMQSELEDKQLKKAEAHSQSNQQLLSELYELKNKNLDIKHIIDQRDQEYKRLNDLI